MRLGFFLPHIGGWAGPDALSRVATRAEELGLDGLWVTERSLLATEPLTPYPLGPLPDVYKRVLDPLDALSFVAAQTSRIGLGTAVLNLPWYSPVLLSDAWRRLTSFRTVGCGSGPGRAGRRTSTSPRAFRGRSAASASRRRSRFSPRLDTDPVQFEGEFFTVPRSFIGPKPVQKPRPPIYLGAFSPSAVARAARYADGWLAVAYPLPDIAAMFSTVQAAAEAGGRDPGELELIVRANVQLAEQPLGDERMAFTGSAEQVASDFSAAHDIGASELIMDATFDPAVTSTDGFVDRMELLTQLAREAAGMRA